jgi:hypothetical protein
LAIQLLLVDCLEGFIGRLGYLGATPLSVPATAAAAVRLAIAPAALILPLAFGRLAIRVRSCVGTGFRTRFFATAILVARTLSALVLATTAAATAISLGLLAAAGGRFFPGLWLLDFRYRCGRLAYQS